MTNLGQQITDQDVHTLAEEFGIEWAMVKTIIEVESEDTGFYPGTYDPVVLFEGKWFHKFTKGKYDKTHPHLSFPVNNKATRVHYRLNQVKRIEQAFELNEEAALLSASWGMMQVMGFNYKMLGYVDVYDFVRDMFTSEHLQVRAGLMYIRKAGLIPAIKAKDFRALRKGYNGDTPTDPYDYEGKLARSYKKWKSTEITQS